jgi:hypothetical protein
MILSVVTSRPFLLVYTITERCSWDSHGSLGMYIHFFYNGISCASLMHYLNETSEESSLICSIQFCRNSSRTSPFSDFSLLATHMLRPEGSGGHDGDACQLERLCIFIGCSFTTSALTLKFHPLASLPSFYIFFFELRI